MLSIPAIDYAPIFVFDKKRGRRDENKAHKPLMIISSV